MHWISTPLISNLPKQCIFVIYYLPILYTGFLRINVTHFVRQFATSKKEDKINNIIRIVRLWATLKCLFLINY